MAAIPGLWPAWQAKLIDRFIGVDHPWMSEIGCSFPPHKYADVKPRLPRWPGQSPPSIGIRCAWRGAAVGDEAVFEFDGEGTNIQPAVGMIRDNGEELPALSGIAVTDELRLRVEAIEDSEVVAVNCSNRRYTRASPSNSLRQRSRFDKPSCPPKRITSEKV
jgi:hypothetical protein